MSRQRPTTSSTRKLAKSNAKTSKDAVRKPRQAVCITGETQQEVSQAEVTGLTPGQPTSIG